MFQSELEMHVLFGKFLDKKINNQFVDYDYEIDHLFGIPDYVLFEKTEKNLKYIISIELKLKDWNRGMAQAFRYKNFSNEVYLILDETYVIPALKRLEEFKRYNIGFATFNKELKFKIYFEPLPEKPHSSFYTFNLLKELTLKSKIKFSNKKLKLWENKQTKFLRRKLNKYLIKK